LLVLASACTQAALNRIDPPVPYAADDKCDQLYDQKCGAFCCHTDRSEGCNPVSAVCEYTGSWYPSVPVGAHRDGGHATGATGVDAGHEASAP
jgi:hypothetical protein